MSFITLSIGCSSHDSSVTLLKDDKIVHFAPSERILKEKRASLIEDNQLRIVRQITSVVDMGVLVNCHDISVDIIQKICGRLGIKVNKWVRENSKHHMFHAAAGFYTHDFDEALCITWDGCGSVLRLVDMVQLSESTSMYYANQDDIKPIYQKFFYRRRQASKDPGILDKELLKVNDFFDYPFDATMHSDIGMMYAIVSRWMGWDGLDSGKTMGLSGYGKPNNLPPMLVEGTVLSNNNLFRNDFFIDTHTYPELANPTEEMRQNMAYNLQKALEYVFVKRVEQGLKLQPSKNLILGGGCALNILGNSVIKRNFPDLNIFVDPIATDASLSLGAALYYYKKEFPRTKYKKLENIYLGPSYRPESLKERLYFMVEDYNRALES